MGCTGLQWVKLGYTELLRVAMGLYWVIVGYSGLNRVKRSIDGLKNGLDRVGADLSAINGTPSGFYGVFLRDLGTYFGRM